MNLTAGPEFSANRLDDRRKRLGEDADKPHRIRYRPLMG